MIHDATFTDTSSFKGANISDLNLNQTKVTDLSPLAGLPLKSLFLDGTLVADLSPLDGMSLERLSLRETLVTDLSVLRRVPLCMSLKELVLYRTKVTDFSPVAACTSLTRFDASETALSDLEPVRDRQLREAYFASTQVRDISILAGMPLQHLYFDRTAVIDVTPLLKCSALETIILPQAAEHVASLSMLPRLSRISYTWDSSIPGPSTTTAEFWPLATPEQLAAREKAEQIRKLLAAGQVDAALPLLAETSAQNDSDTVLALKVAALQAWFGKNADHEATCARMLSGTASTQYPHIAERVAKLTNLCPIADPQMRDAALVLARRAVELGQKTNLVCYCQLSLGMAEYRCGNLDAAASMLEKAEQGAPSNQHIPGTAAFYRVMVLFKQSKAAEARQLFHDTKMKMKPLPLDDQNPFANGSDHDDVVLWLACKEAGALLHEPVAARP